MNKHTDNTTIIPKEHQENSNADLEELILGYVFFYIKPEYFQSVLEIVNENHFFFRENKIVFLALKEALKQDVPLHPKTIRYLLKSSDFAHLGDIEELPNNNGLDKYFVKIMSNVELGVFHLDIEKLCFKLKDLSTRREWTTGLNRLFLDAKNPKISTIDQIDSAQQLLVKISKEQLLDQSSDKFASILPDIFTRLKKQHESEEKGISEELGVPTGFPELDKLLCGFRKSNLIILGARPSMGKTALALNITLRIAKKLRERRLRNSLQESNRPSTKGNILFFSLESSSREIGQRLLALEANVNLSKMIAGTLSNCEFQKIEKVMESISALDQLNISIEHDSSPRIEDIRRKANKIAMTGDLSLIVVDYLQLISAQNSGKKNDGANRVIEVARITAGLKSIAKDLDVPIIALSQLSRDVEKRTNNKPVKSDLRDSGSIEQDADVILMLYREEVYLEQEKPDNPDDPLCTWNAKMEQCKNQADVFVRKNRDGATGSIKIAFDKEVMKFYSLDKNLDKNRECNDNIQDKVPKKRGFFDNK